MRPATLIAPLLMLLLALQALPARAQLFNEYEVKAAYLYNFVAFSEWPQDVGDSIHVCVLGRGPAVHAVQRYDGRAAGAHRLAVRNIRETAVAVLECEVVFAPRGTESHLAWLVATTRGRPILTVSEVEGWPGNGIMIQLSLTEERVVFEVNYDAVRQSGISVSSKVLRLARAVYRETRP